jgi:hypothetical protein
MAGPRSQTSGLRTKQRPVGPNDTGSDIRSDSGGTGADSGQSALTWGTFIGTIFDAKISTIFSILSQELSDAHSTHG